MLPGIGWCGTGLLPFLTASWWLTHPAAVNRGFPTRMVYLRYISCLRYTILVGNPQNGVSDATRCNILSVCPPVGVLTNTPLPPFLTASSAEPSVYICVKSACKYFSSSISRLRAICCVGICCSAGSRPGTSRKMVALRCSWFQSVPQRRFPSLICGSRMSLWVLLRSLAKWFRLCLFSLCLVGAASLLRRR